MALDISEMRPEEAREHIARLEISQQAFARMIRVNPTTVRRWLRLDGEALDIPRAVQIALRLLTPAMVRRLMAAGQEGNTDES
jgi:DNA-binding transcriptional regulator YiaG